MYKSFSGNLIDWLTGGAASSYTMNIPSHGPQTSAAITSSQYDVPIGPVKPDSANAIQKSIPTKVPAVPVQLQKPLSSPLSLSLPLSGTNLILILGITSMLGTMWYLVQKEN